VFEEFAEGINSVAAPVFGPDGVTAALRIHGPTYRFPDPDRTHDIGLLVAAAASRLSEQLQQYTP
jgi:DNA-binding IclR family transcriptional regulator